MIKSASVKIMLSYDYSHFETSMSLENENGITTKDIDDARKECRGNNRLFIKDCQPATEDEYNSFRGTQYKR